MEGNREKMRVPVDVNPKVKKADQKKWALPQKMDDVNEKVEAAIKNGQQEMKATVRAREEKWRPQ